MDRTEMVLAYTENNQYIIKFELPISILNAIIIVMKFLLNSVFQP